MTYVEIATKVRATMKATARPVSLLFTICTNENTEINDNNCVQVVLTQRKVNIYTTEIKGKLSSPFEAFLAVQSQ